MNALDAILLYLNQASTPLERAQPNIADVEVSLEKAKTAVKLLQGAKALLEESIFHVADEPFDGTPLPFEEPKSVLRRVVQDIADGMGEDESMGISIPGGPSATIRGTGKGRRK